MIKAYSLDILAEMDQMAQDYPEQDLPHTELAADYLEKLLSGKRQLAVELILNQVETGLPVKDVYLYVLQRSLQEVGRLWQFNEITVAQEHYFSAATQMIMSLLYPQIFSGPKNGRTLVATCVGQELHEIGIRMVADFLEMDGWNTFFLGANTPPRAVLKTIQDQKADLLALSTTITHHIPLAEEYIQLIREEDPDHGVKILVGGRPFNLVPELWKRVGADGYARRADQAVVRARKLLGEED